MNATLEKERRRHWRNYKRCCRQSIAALKRGDLLAVCRIQRLVSKHYLACDATWREYKS